MAWACEDWIELAIEQTLNLVDELILIIGAFHPYFLRIGDNTLKKAKKYLNNNKIRFFNSIIDQKKNADQNRATTANHMLQSYDHFKEGDVIWILDADEFYSEEAIEEIKNFITNIDFNINL